MKEIREYKVKVMRTIDLIVELPITAPSLKIAQERALYKAFHLSDGHFTSRWERYPVVTTESSKERIKRWNDGK